MPVLAERLSRGNEIISAPGVKEADLLSVVGTADAFVATAMDVSERVLAAGSRLLVVGTPQVGFDRIDVAAATRLGIPVISSAGVSPGSVAEFTLGLMIALSRRIVFSDRDLHAQRNWAARARYADATRDLGVELAGCTVGIVGVGHIGIALAGLCRAAFNTEALGFDPYVDAARMQEAGLTKVEELRELVAASDFVLLHMPLTEATHHLFGSDLLKAMKPSSFLINCARGGVVDEVALGTALNEGWFAGAALDVFEREPLSGDDPLLDIDRLVLTPHIAGVTLQSNEQRASAFVDRLLQVTNGEQPAGLANPDVWPAYLKRRSELGSSTR